MRGLSSLQLFTQPLLLAQIGHLRLPLLLRPFTADLLAAGIAVPEPPPSDELRIPDPPLDSGQGLYFTALAQLFADYSDALPNAFHQTLLALEQLASPENRSQLEDIFSRRLPCVSPSPFPLDRALEVWFCCPDELDPFKPAGLSPRPSDLSPPADNIFLLSPRPSHLSSPADNTSLLSPRPSDLSPPVGLLLNSLCEILRRFVILPKHAAEALALWIVHTYAFQLRDVSIYIGIESPEKRCGKTTLLGVLAKLVNRPVVASNISPSAFFRVIEEMQPTLLIDEADTFLQGNYALRGILNAGYHRPNAYVIRVSNEPVPARRAIHNGNRSPSAPNLNTEHCTLNTAAASDVRASTFVLRHFSTWCPKIIAAIGHLPDTLADRCIAIRMQRKRGDEECERLRNLDFPDLRNNCAQFVLEHQHAIANARPEIPEALNDRAADIWEPLLAIADLAGGSWPEKARAAALHLSAGADDPHPLSSLLLDIFISFTISNTDRIFSRNLVGCLNVRSANRPWAERRNGKPITELWLSQQLRPYGIRPRNVCIGDQQAKGYLQEDFREIFRRYIPKAEAQACIAELTASNPEQSPPAQTKNPGHPT